MKNKLYNPLFLLAFCGIFFGIGLINTWGFGANSFNEMFWWGRFSFSLFFITFTWMIWVFSFKPIIKKLFSNKK